MDASVYAVLLVVISGSTSGDSSLHVFPLGSVLFYCHITDIHWFIADKIGT